MDEREDLELKASEDIKTEEGKTEEEVKAAEEVLEPVADEERAEEEAKEEKVEEEAEKEEKEKEEVPAENSEAKDDKVEPEAPVEEKEEKEKEEGEKEGEEGQEEEVNEDVALKLAEAEAKLAEIEEEKAFNKKVAEAQQQTDYVVKTFSDFRIRLGKDLEAEFKRYNIDTKKSINELREEDPAKAELAINLTNQAMKLMQDAEAQCKKMINDNVAGLIFDKASRKFAKFEATPEQMKLACDTFVDIFKSVGIGNMSSQLDKAVELSIARAKFLLPEKAKAEDEKNTKAEDDTVEVKQEEVVVNTNDSAAAEKDSDNEKSKEEKKAEEKKTEEPEVKVEPVDAEAFEEGTTGKATVSNPDGVTAENVIEKYLATPYKERVAFYKKYYQLMKL